MRVYRVKNRQDTLYAQRPISTFPKYGTCKFIFHCPFITFVKYSQIDIADSGAND